MTAGVATARPARAARPRRKEAPKPTRSGILATAFMFVCAIYFLLPAWWLVALPANGPSTPYSS